MKVVIAFSLLIAIATCSAEASGAQDVEIRLDLNNRLPVSKSLYGIFFEEVRTSKGSSCGHKSPGLWNVCDAPHAPERCHYLFPQGRSITQQRP